MKILIVKTSAIGDVIQSFPTLEYLRAKFPKSQIDWAVESSIAPLLKAHPQIDNVIEIKTRGWRAAPFSGQTQREIRAFSKQLRSTQYDILFDLQGNIKSALVTAHANAKAKVGFGWNTVREKVNLFATNQWIEVPSPENVRLKYLRLVQGYFKESGDFSSNGIHLNISSEEKDRLQDVCSKLQKRPRIMVCFGSKWANKRLDETTLMAFLEKISKAFDPSFVLIYGNPKEKKIADHLAASLNAIAIGHLSLPLWQALMWEMDTVIAVDSAALHLCGTTQVPSFSTFGPTMGTYYKPLEDRHAVLQGPCPYGKQFPSQCPRLRTCKTGACIRDLKAEELFLKFSQGFLGSRQRSPDHLEEPALPLK